MDTLTIKKIKEETHDSKSFYIDPKSTGLEWKPNAGQYITIEVEVKGETLRRSYSLSSGTFEQDLSFTIKRVDQGRVSNYMMDHVKEGDTLKMLKPDGKFELLADPDRRNDFYFIAAGSGVTPIMSMIKTVLEEEPKSTCYLLYGNRSEDDIIFEAELAELSQTYKDQLYVVHTLSKPKKIKKGGLSGLLSSGKVTWKGWKGRVNEEKILKFLQDYPSKSGKDKFYICGPGNFISSAQEILLGQGFDKTVIKKEHFTAPEGDQQKSTVVPVGTTHILKVTLDGQQFEVEHSNDKTVLETIIQAGHDAPYSCTAGACSTCVCKVKSGEVTMDTCFALDDDEIADGYILSCQAKVITPELEIEFE